MSEEEKVQQGSSIGKFMIVNIRLGGNEIHKHAQKINNKIIIKNVPEKA